MVTVDSTEEKKFGIVDAVLCGIFVLPLLIIWLVSFWLAPRKSDHARVGFTWMKLVFLLYAATLALYVASDALELALIARAEDSYSSASDSDSDWDLTTYNGLYTKFVRVSSIAQLPDTVATAFLLITLVEIGNGFLYVLTQTRTQVQKGLRFAAWLIAGIPIFLSVAQLALTLSAWARYFDYEEGKDRTNFSFSTFEEDLKTCSRIGGALSIMFWIMTLPLVAYAGIVVHKVKGIPALRGSSILFLVATILLSVRYIWQLGYVATWTLNDHAIGAPSRAFGVIYTLFTVWVMFVVLVLLFQLGIRKQGGLWTTNQPWMNNMNEPVLAQIPGQGGWGQEGMYAPQQQQPVYQQDPTQQSTYATPHVYKHPQENPAPYASEKVVA